MATIKNIKYKIENSGYYRYPTIRGQTIVFVCEDDLWSVSAEGGVARRLTAGLGEVTHPALSPDGKLVAFTGREEGLPDVYVMPAAGGPVKRLTFLGALMMRVAGWDGRSSKVLFASGHDQPFPSHRKLFTVNCDGGLPAALAYGPADHIDFGPSSAVVLGRNTGDPARWKRYRGGTCGQIWVDAKGTGTFRRLANLQGNPTCPMWIGRRIYFLSDHEGIANIYSCRPTGSDLRRHTDEDTFYARNASTDGKCIVYHCGAKLCLYDPATDQRKVLDITHHSPQTQRNRKFVSPSRYMESYGLHPSGHSLVLTTRGKAFTGGNWEGPVIQHGEPDGVRYRLASYLQDGKRLVCVSDKGGTESLVIFHADESKAPTFLPRLDIGRAIDLVVSPTKSQVLIHNHRHELILVDLKTQKMKRLDRSQHARLRGLAWSPDGHWAAYAIHESPQTSIIKLCRLSTGRKHRVTKPVLWDVSPSFDPDGKYLYFLSHRVFDPVYDSLQFDLNFPRGVRPYLVTLQRDLPSPFLAGPVVADQKQADESSESGKQAKRRSINPVKIDLDGIEDRIVALPVPEGRYAQIRGLPKGKLMYTTFPVEGSLNKLWTTMAPPANGTLEMFDLAERTAEPWIQQVSSFDLSADFKTLIYRSGAKLRVLKATEKPKSEAATEGPGRKSGWIDQSRGKVSVNPPDEWRQMYHEAWRLMRDHFWTANMSTVDWKKVRDRYLPLLDRVASRSEFSDLMWEMQGELGTSHAYELGGDYRQSPRYDQGFLGADFTYHVRSGGYQVTHVVEGDPWNQQAASPLQGPGLNIKPGDVLLAIGGQKLSQHVTPHELLVNRAGAEVQVTIQSGQRRRNLIVKCATSETNARYRQWVESNRHRVHDATKGRVGYIHIPNMGPFGYAEFHRYYLAEVERDGLVIDVRFNGGGHVSSLILEKLLRKRVGYAIQRWGQPVPYPEESVMGPMVALTNERAGSDGDIFSHCFKLMKLGPLIGKRTWGGVIGIWPRHALVDGSITTQPEFSFWFDDVGWGVENYGTDPDIEVDIAPQDDAAGRDPQMDRAISEIKKLLRTTKPRVPDFTNRPKLALPI